MNQGVILQFANGYGVSMRWGWCNYCDNRDQDDTFVSRKSDTAELAVINADGELIYSEELYDLTGLDHDDVCAYISADEVVDICNRVKCIAKPS